MRKIIFSVFLGVFLMGGCNVGETKETVSVKLHQITPIEFKETKNLVERVISIIDPRDNKIVEVMDPTEFLSEDELKAKAVQFASDLAKTIDRPMKPSKLGENGDLKPGQSKMILKEDELVRNILDPSIFNKEVILPIEVVNPNVTQDSVAGIDEYVLGSFTTYFDPHVEGRNFNIKKSADELNNIVLGPGDQFSFNTVVGNASKENGYALATVIVNKQFVPGYGGGVCQTSSTLYNAVAEAGLEIIELHHHSKSVGYVPQGKDATIAFPYLDFKFANNHPYPIVLKTIVDIQAGTLEVQVRTASSNVN